ncbi:MAG: M15 family metallopeptidase [Erysipelotrichaceae bacterium]|nr:M15 family metallopeptidase [Erysipelotrichaceae bacterium]MDD4642089.1 M15 family metallopeptidase [Erysipelotrichaceae bacterium]
MTVQRIRRKKRRLRRKIKYGLFVILTIAFIIAIFLVVIPFIDQMRLSSMGYSRESAKNIVSQKLTKTVLSREYSAAFDTNMIKEIDVKEYLELYYVTVDIDDTDKLLYDRLQDLGYQQMAVLKVFSALTFNEITPLLVFNSAEDLDIYIADVIANRDQEIFVLSNNYTDHYENIKTIDDSSAIDVLINKYRATVSDYVPDLVDMSVQYASSGQQLQTEAYQAFTKMVDAMKSDGLGGIYVYSGYRSYQTQERIYNNYVRSKGQQWADRYSARPGHSEHQLGLAVDVTATKSPSAAFETTPEYLWLQDNAYRYGFIMRYPEDSELITGYGYEPWHYRYLGVELATKVYQSGLTYDEYKILYGE